MNINKLGERGRAYFGFQPLYESVMRIYVRSPYLIGKTYGYVKFYVRTFTATTSPNYDGIQAKEDTFYYDLNYKNQKGKYIVDIYRVDGSNNKHIYLDEIVFTV